VSLVKESFGALLPEVAEAAVILFLAAYVTKAMILDISEEV
jgi:hypothetical protein